MNAIASLVGRFGLAALFLLAGVGKLGAGYAGTQGYFDEIAVPDIRAAQDELEKFMQTRYGNVLASVKEKKNLDDALKNDLDAALKEFQQHFKSMKATAGAR